MATERVGILGSGDVGRALAAGFAGRGWDVLVGTRSPEKLEEWVSDVEEAASDGAISVGAFTHAAAHGDVAASRYLEALVPLWVRVGEKLGTYGHAFAAVE